MCKKHLFSFCSANDAFKTKLKISQLKMLFQFDKNLAIFQQYAVVI